MGAQQLQINHPCEFLRAQHEEPTTRAGTHNRTCASHDMGAQQLQINHPCAARAGNTLSVHAVAQMAD